MRPYYGERHPLWTPLVVLLLALPVLLAVLYLNLALPVFRLLGLSPVGAVLLLAASLLGGLINIPLSRRRIELAPDPRLTATPAWIRWLLPVVHYYPPRVVEQVLALNLGGAVVPMVFSAYLLTRPTTSWLAVLLATAIVALVVKLLARPTPGAGVTLPMFVSPLVAAVAARALIEILGQPALTAAPVAYIAGTIGTLIGADLLNLRAIMRGSLLDQELDADADADADVWGFGGGSPSVSRRYIASIGGAGVFDGIFLTGIVAPLLAAL